MPRKRFPRKEPDEPRAPKAEQVKGGVRVTYPGHVLPPVLPPLPKHRCCKQCGYGPVTTKHRYASTATHYFFRCPRCVDPETCRPSTWKEARGGPS